MSKMAILTTKFGWSTVSIVLIAVLADLINAQTIAPSLIPMKPKPFFSWEKIPTAFHGANKYVLFCTFCCFVLFLFTSLCSFSVVIALLFHSFFYLILVVVVFFTNVVRSGVYNDDAVELLAKYQMVTIEKWYTPCASQGPKQGDPSCAVESKIEHVLGRIKALNPNVTKIMCGPLLESHFILI